MDNNRLEAPRMTIQEWPDLEPPFMTPSEAQTVELPSFIHPIERVRKIGELSAAFYLFGRTPIDDQLAYTRRGLVKIAESFQKY